MLRAASKKTRSPMAIEPRCGVSRPATARNSVVLPLPDGPSSATTSPAGTASGTPLRISLSPRRRATSLTMSSTMQAHSKADRDGKADADHDHVDDRQRRHQIDGAGTPQRNQKRTDHFRARTEQINAGRVFAYKDQEDQKPARQHAVLDQRHGDVALHAKVVGTRGARGLFKLGPHLQQRSGNEPHAVGKPNDC